MHEFLKYEDFLLEKKWNKEIESSHLTDIKYDDKTEILVIEFRDGSVYQYEDVPKKVFRLFADEKTLLGKAGSYVKKKAKKLLKKETNEGTYGTRFWNQIRNGKYKYKKIK